MKNESSQITARQHYVPQFYLRRFVNERNEVEVLDCKERTILAPSGPKGLCYEKFFYGLETGAPDDVSQQIEEAFQQIENEIARNLDPITNKILDGSQILNDEKWLIALLMSLLWIRGPLVREELNEMSESMMKQISKITFDHPSIENFLDRHDRKTGKATDKETREQIKKMIREGDYSVRFNNALHLRMFENVGNFANLFWGQDWIVYISRTKKLFITSDNPVAVVIPKREGFYGPTFLEREHYFPLTPSILIHGRYPTDKTGKKLRRRTLFDGQKFPVLNLNLIISGFVQRHAFATSRESLEDILLAVKYHEERVKPQT